MKNLRPRGGPFASRPYFTDQDVERMCTDELRKYGYLPATPGPVKIDRFVEKRFGVSPRYEEMPDGVLGFSLFGASGMTSMHVSAALAEGGSRAAERRVNTTLAHEAGHGLMHAHLFVLADADGSLFGEDPDVGSQRILCREDRDEAAGSRRGYDGRWWEHQANMAIGPLLMPQALVVAALAPFRSAQGSLGASGLDPSQRDGAIRHLVNVFDVNAQVAAIRLGKVFPPPVGGQLML